MTAEALPARHRADYLPTYVPEEEFLIIDKSVSGLMVSRLTFSSSFTKDSVLVELEDEPLLVDV